MGINSKMANLLEALFGNGNTPGAPGGTQPNQGQQSTGILGNPFLANLLAQSGYSFTPQSPFGAIGKAALATQGQQRQSSQDDLQKRLIESRIGLNQRQAELGGNPSGGNVQSQFITEDGKLGFLRRNGEVVVTEQDVKNQFSIQELADGSRIAVNNSNPQNIVPVVTPDQAANARTRQLETDDQVKASIALPESLANLDSRLAKVDATIDTVRDVKSKVSDKTTGFTGARLGGIEGTKAFDLRANVKTIQANLGFDQLQKMREASKSGGALGQVSERELDLLTSAVNSLNPDQSREQLEANLDKVITHYDNYKREIEKMKRIMRERAGEAPALDFSSMSTEELERIASGSE